MNDVEKVDRYRTTDGKEFWSLDEATRYQVSVNAANKATEQLCEGMSIAEILRRTDYPGEPDAILEQVTKDSKLVISHWQCRDTPEYKVIRVLPGGSVYCWGGVGAWCNSYGGAVTIANLVRYAKDKHSLLTPKRNESEANK